MDKDIKNDNECIQGRIRATKHRALVDELTASMTLEQLEEEKKFVLNLNIEVQCY